MNGSQRNKYRLDEAYRNKKKAYSREYYRNKIKLDNSKLYKETAVIKEDRILYFDSDANCNPDFWSDFNAKKINIAK